MLRKKNIIISLIFALMISLTVSLGVNRPALLTNTAIIVWVFVLSWSGILLGVFWQNKQQINELYKLFPKDKNKKETPKNIDEISKKITALTQSREKELDILHGRENYRREFIGNVAHELKTPLFSIQGYLLTLIEGGVDDENIRDKYLNRINKSVERLTYIVKDLDLITELESGNLKLEIYPFNIVALVQEVYDLLEIKAENNQVKLRFDKNYENSIKVVGDIEKIEQVLLNLIANAINHSQRPATVTVAIQNIAKNKIKISIKDTGLGIKTEQLKRIFERFYRADKSRSRQQGGSGLGLAIVKHILEAHQQEIQVESTYGEGTVFSFFLDKA